MRTVGLTAPADKPAAKGRKDRPTKAELLDQCEQLGIEPPEGATNAALAELIADADAPAVEDEA